MTAKSEVPTDIPEEILQRLDHEYRDFILSQPATSRTPAHQIGWSLELRKAIDSNTVGKGTPIPVGSTEVIHLGELPILVLTPDGAVPKDGWPVFIHMHGGGFICGNSRTEETFITRACMGARCAVVSVDYRLAPEHTSPAALDDVWKVLQWVYIEGSPGVKLNGKKIVVGGYSTGGTLAAATAQRAAVSQPSVPLIGQIILMAPLDFTYTYEPETWSQSMREYSKAPGFWTYDLLWSRDMHTPKIDDRSRPDISPLLQEQEQAFTNMAPAWIGVAELDILRSDGEHYANKLKARDVPVELKTYIGAAHLTVRADGVCELARRIQQDQIEFLKAVFDG